MIKNTLKEKLINREPVNGMHISIPAPELGEIVSPLGYDFIWIDTEHSAIDMRTLNQMLNNVKLYGSSTFVRVPVDDYNITKKVLEMGPDAILFPMVNTKDQAERVIKSTLYPPYGTRGCGPMRAVRYGFDDANEYFIRGSFEMARLVQIETEEAVNNLDEILVVPYIDGFVFGYCDLSASTGELGQTVQPQTYKLIEHACKKLTEKGKSFGFSHSNAPEEIIRFYLKNGANIVSSGVDYDYVLQGAINMRDRINKVRTLVSGEKTVQYNRNYICEEII